MRCPALLLCLLALGPLASAQTQPVYRCGNEYSQVACPQGKVVDVTDQRTPQQRAEAQQLNASEARRAAEMRRERLAEQAAQKSPAAASLSAAPAAKPASSAERKKPKRKHSSVKKPASAPSTTPFTARDSEPPAKPRR